MSLSDQVILNNFVDSITKAIIKVGGDVSHISHLCDYQRVIEEQLVAGKSEFVEGDGININIDGGIKTISADSSATIISDINETLPKGTPIQNVLENILLDVIPSLPEEIATNNGMGESDIINIFNEVFEIK